MSTSNNSIPNVLYHYCDIDALRQIIEKKKLWLCDITHSNDKMEMKILHEFIQIVLKTEYKNKFSDIKELEKLYSRNVYATCFSKQKDVLSQWRAYAADGSGVAIGFLSENLGIPNLIPERSWFEQHSIGLAMVEYVDPQNTKDVIDKIIKVSNQTEINSAREILMKLDFNNLSTSLRDVNPSDYHLFLYNILKYSSVLKHFAFSEEQEYRILFWPLFDETGNLQVLNRRKEFAHNNNDISRLSPLYSRTTRGKISTYFEYDFMKSTTPIAEIVLGPKCKIEKDELLMFLKMNSIDVSNIKIYQSQAPYV